MLPPAPVLSYLPLDELMRLLIDLVRIVCASGIYLLFCGLSERTPVCILVPVLLPLFMIDEPCVVPVFGRCELDR